MALTLFVDGRAKGCIAEEEFFESTLQRFLDSALHLRRT
jgi:hypothetical protein